MFFLPGAGKLFSDEARSVNDRAFEKYESGEFTYSQFARRKSAAKILLFGGFVTDPLGTSAEVYKSLKSASKD